jgi:hypothetical protein
MHDTFGVKSWNCHYLILLLYRYVMDIQQIEKMVDSLLAHLENAHAN